MSRRSLAAALAVSSSILAFPLSGETYRNAPARPLVVMTSNVRSASAEVTQVPSRVALNALFLFADRTLVQSFNGSSDVP